MVQFSLDAQRQFDRFRRQYFQLEAQQDLSFPDASYLHRADFQQALYENLFRDGCMQYAPPQRYQMRVLKELLRRIEESITNWDEDVGIQHCNSLDYSILSPCHFPEEGLLRYHA